MKSLYFIRHGECEANARGVWSDDDKSPLTELGKKQAEAAAQQAAKEGLTFNLIISSPYVRTIDTAHIIAKGIGYPDDLILIDPLLKERMFGDMEGVNIQNYLSKHVYQDIDAVSGAETIEQLQKRAAKLLHKLRELPEQTILLVGHNVFGRALRREINRQPYTTEYTGDQQKAFIENAKIVRLI